MESGEVEAREYAFPLSLLKTKIEVEVDPFKNIPGDYLGLIVPGRRRPFMGDFKYAIWRIFSTIFLLVLFFRVEILGS